MPLLSIIIPTHKRPEILRQCLEHIERQTIADQLEVIVVGDGHDPHIPEFTSHVPVHFYTLAKSHQGVARNEGVKHAKGDYCLFIGDDIFLEPDACEKHLEAHHRVMVISTNHDTMAVLGFTTWDPAVGITPVMRWLEKTGWQFGYGKIARYAHNFIPENIQHRFTYTSHLSLPTNIAREHAFRDDVSHYGWEDIEWGLRLRQAGVRVYYEPAAKALHHHRITLEHSLRRMEVIGKSLASISLKNPEFDRMPHGWKWWAYCAVSVLPTLRGKHCQAFVRGITHKSSLHGTKWSSSPPSP